MRIAYVDCYAGAAGDMFLGALVDAGLPLEVLEEELAGLPLAGVRLEREQVRRGAVAATKVHVRLEGAGEAPRCLADLETAVAGHRLGARMAAVFRRMAEAEARVHGTTPEAVHLHEVGALDALVDIAGTVAGLDRLGIERLHAAPVPTGRGTVRTSHGLLPVPPPAVAELLRGVPSYGGGIEGEATTPTGAALLVTLAAGFGPQPPMRIERIGYGAGDADRPLSNCLRLFVGETEGPLEAEERIQVIEFAVDDMPGQWTAALCDRLLAAGAVDVYTTAVGMKKARPGALITVLCAREAEAEVLDLVFRESTTLGVRRRTEERVILDRRHETVDTPYGPVRLKVASRASREVHVQPEFEDVLARARASDTPVKEVHRAALAAWHAHRS